MKKIWWWIIFPQIENRKMFKMKPKEKMAVQANMFHFSKHTINYEAKKKVLKNTDLVLNRDGTGEESLFILHPLLCRWVTHRRRHLKIVRNRSKCK